MPTKTKKQKAADDAAINEAIADRVRSISAGDPALRAFPTSSLAELYEALKIVDSGFEAQRRRLEEAYTRHFAFKRDGGMRTCQHFLDELDQHEKVLRSFRERVREEWARRTA
jgi:hypothetical protein